MNYIRMVLQRDRFLPFIELFKNNMQVIALDGDVDYRLQFFRNIEKTYITPLGKKSEGILEKRFHELTHDKAIEKDNIQYEIDLPGNRKIKAKAVHGDIAWFDFTELCEKPYGAADYIEIAEDFTTILLSGIKKLGENDFNAAKRFTLFIDALYEHKVKFLCVAEVEVDKLYEKGKESFEFGRTASRLF